MLISREILQSYLIYKLRFYINKRKATPVMLATQSYIYANGSENIPNNLVILTEQYNIEYMELYNYVRS
jgi:DNA-dependent RNA polymerase auxiliary subunit epsilon